MQRSPGTPGSITAAAVLMFIYGGFLLLCGVCGGVMTVAMPDQGGQQARMQAMLDAGAPGHQIVQFGSMGLHILIGFAMVGAGIGVLRWSNVARIIACIAIVLEVIVTVGNGIFQIVFIMPVTNRFIAEVVQAQQKQGAPPPPFDLNAFMTGTGIATIFVMILIKFALLLPIGICLNLAGARAAFSGKLDAPPIDDDRDRDRPRDDDDYNLPPRPKNPGDTGISERT